MRSACSGTQDWSGTVWLHRSSEGVQIHVLKQVTFQTLVSQVLRLPGCRMIPLHCKCSCLLSEMRTWKLKRWNGEPMVYLGDLPSKVVAIASWQSSCLHFACARIQPVHREALSIWRGMTTLSHLLEGSWRQESECFWASPSPVSVYRDVHKWNVFILSMGKYICSHTEPSLHLMLLPPIFVLQYTWMFGWACVDGRAWGLLFLSWCGCSS